MMIFGRRLISLVRFSSALTHPKHNGTAILELRDLTHVEYLVLRSCQKDRWFSELYLWYGELGNSEMRNRERNTEKLEKIPEWEYVETIYIDYV